MKKNRVVCGLGVSALLLAGCGSGDDEAADATAAPASAESASAAPQSTAASGAERRSDGRSRRHGGAGCRADRSACGTGHDRCRRGPATGEPIKIGFVNLEGGAISLPELRIGVETAAEYINQHGGAGGRPLEIISCNVDGTPRTIDRLCQPALERRRRLDVRGLRPEQRRDAADTRVGRHGADRPRRLRAAAAGLRRRLLLRDRQPVVHRRIPRLLRERPAPRR